MTDRSDTPQSPLADLRTPEQRARDKAVVQKQVQSLLSSPDGVQATGADVVARMRGRQQGQGPQGILFDVHPPADGGIEALIVQNELVVETSDQQLSRFGSRFNTYAGPGRPGRRTRVFRGTGKSVADVRADAAHLRANGVRANVNLIVPLGYVVKGDTFPGETSVQRTFTPGNGGSPVRVAVIDTGMTNQSRTDGWFTGIKSKGVDKLNEVKPLDDRNDYFAGHGTFTAGIIRQRSATCEIVVYRFTRTDGLGTDTDAADMLIRAADDANAEAPGRPLIINASFGAPAVDGAPPVALQEAVEYIAQTYPQVLIVASAGNDGSDQPLYPAGFTTSNVRAVGALNPDGSRAAFSNYGNWVHCSAVGVGIVSTFVKGLTPPEPDLGVPDVDFPAGAWATWTGTSFSAPQIAGEVARLCAQTAGLKPQAAFDQLLQGKPTLPGSTTVVVHLLDGTPVE